MRILPVLGVIWLGLLSLSSSSCGLVEKLSLLLEAEEPDDQGDQGNQGNPDDPVDPGDPTGEPPIPSGEAGLIPADPDNIWISPAELRALPKSGSGYSGVKSAADSAGGAIDLSDQDGSNDVKALAAAYMYIIDNNPTYRTKAKTAILGARGSEERSDARALSIGREAQVIPIIAKLIDLPSLISSAEHNEFKVWLRQLLTFETSSHSLMSCARERPNNWGTHCITAVLTILWYLGDFDAINNSSASNPGVLQVFKGWLGDRNSYSGFEYGELDWQCDPAHPVGINPAGCMRNGHSIDGVLPDDQRRAGGFSWPPPHENYVYEALQGATATWYMLSRLGYTEVFDYQDSAILRALSWLKLINFDASGDDQSIPFLVNKFAGTNYPVDGLSTGKGINSYGAYLWAN